jgi:hypothetical protein
MRHVTWRKGAGWQEVFNATVRKGCQDASSKALLIQLPCGRHLQRTINEDLRVLPKFAHNDGCTCIWVLHFEQGIGDATADGFRLHTSCLIQHGQEK